MELFVLGFGTIMFLIILGNLRLAYLKIKNPKKWKKLKKESEMYYIPGKGWGWKF